GSSRAARTGTRGTPRRRRRGQPLLARSRGGDDHARDEQKDDHAAVWRVVPVRDREGPRQDSDRPATARERLQEPWSGLERRARGGEEQQRGRQLECPEEEAGTGRRPRRL